MLQAILLQAPAPQGNALMSIFMIVLMIVIFYFFMIRPQTKRQKELQKAREAMKAGDKVITSEACTASSARSIRPMVRSPSRCGMVSRSR